VPKRPKNWKPEGETKDHRKFPGPLGGTGVRNQVTKRGGKGPPPETQMSGESSKVKKKRQ